MSFALCSTADSSLLTDDQPLSWTWSSDLRHLLILDTSRQKCRVRRWDSPGDERATRFPNSPVEAQRVLDGLYASAPPSREDSIWHALTAFRILREILAGASATDVVRSYNVLLAGAESVADASTPEQDWLACQTIAEVIALVDAKHFCGTEVDAIDPAAQTHNIGQVIANLLATDFPWRLNPKLLLRHASGRLYQEAHITLEKNGHQLVLPGLATGSAHGGSLQKDVRFTPANLARFLAQLAFDGCYGEIAKDGKITVLDPACGSGIFLVESFRELQARGFKGALKLHGMDISPVSVAISRFCLSRLAHDASESGIDLDVEIAETDSLTADWGEPTVVLTNPPFAGWESMADNDQEILRDVLGDLASGRQDKSIGFAWKALHALSEGGTLGIVLPAPVLESRAALRWRQAISNMAFPLLVGSFRGFDYFKYSLVEPAFLVLKRGGLWDTETVQFVLANRGTEDLALKQARLGKPLPSPGNAWDTFKAPRELLTETSWQPRMRAEFEFIKLLEDAGMPAVQELFDIHQGARTGRKAVFLVSTDELGKLPESESKYFRPAATSPAIRDGRLHDEWYIFYPYDESGLTLSTQEELKNAVPEYYKTRLLPEKEALRKRRGVKADEWWALTWERNWQRGITPKLVTKYYGRAGSFALDDTGESVVVQGYAWMWKGSLTTPTGYESFWQTDLPLAYLALLNSQLFEYLLGNYCPRVKGGQLNLSNQFVAGIPLPDLSDTDKILQDLVHELALAGEKIQKGKLEDWRPLDHLAASAYGLPESLMTRMQVSPYWQ